jgi:hypothetical protein
MIAQRQIEAQVSRINDLSTDELRQALAFCYRHIADQDELTSNLENDNHQLRLQVADLEDELQRREEERDRYKHFLDWTKDLFSNKTIPAACKFVLWHFWLAFFLLRPTQTGEEMRIGVEATASALGMSKDTVRKATDKAEAFDLLKRRYEPITLSDGSKMTLAHITLNDHVSNPDGIVMEKLHGGKRVKRCPGCGSEDVDRYTVQYCRCCQKAAWYGQPGLRADADVLDAQNAVAAMTHKALVKQDAFEDTAADQPTDCPPVPADLPPISPASTATIEKQDAFEKSSDQAHHILPEEKHLATEHTYTNHGKLQQPPTPPVVKERVVVCNAVTFLNAAGGAARAMVNGHAEKIVGEKVCGSTRWTWVGNQAVCAECWTPMPLEGK